MVYNVLNNILDTWHGMYGYESHIECIFVGIIMLLFVSKGYMLLKISILYSSKYYIFWYVFYNKMVKGLEMIIKMGIAV